jgi:hypothetical protein
MLTVIMVCCMAKARCFVRFACRASQWANHFEVTNINTDLGNAEGYTYDLEWSPDAIKPPIKQKVRGVPPAYIECVPNIYIYISVKVMLLALRVDSCLFVVLFVK